MMAYNNTTAYSMTQQLRDTIVDGIILSFSVSVVIGIAIGMFIWILLACLSRKKQASATISQTTSRRTRTSPNNAVLTRTSFYRTNSYERHGDSNLPLASTLTFQRQWSQEHADSYGRKQSFRASTFHPFAQSPLADELGGIQSSSALLRTDTSSTLNCSLGPHEQRWSESRQYDCHSSQTPPPAYEFVVELTKETLA
ncbi:myc target protein 1 homolog isoform X1 [Leucoraja erinacea]|uniref:myc target protein 1 homolog isoform X1 n=2 Tax=Leucoraja erinaceus TaxID=7782 RepID=UPI002454F40B|nr:myc target protein 1 homolog isoform X1 [Leucoraja erinacea]